jgi:hypothetical protein
VPSDDQQMRDTVSFRRYFDSPTRLLEGAIRGHGIDKRLAERASVTETRLG